MDDEWMDQAACLERDPEIFFWGDTTSDNRQDVINREEAKEICNGCDVVSDCLEYALVNNISDGVWGAHTSEERRAIRRKNPEKYIGHIAMAPAI